MGKKLAIFGVAALLCVVGLVFFSGCDDEATAAGGEGENVCDVEVACDVKTVEECEEKKAAGDCPVEKVEAAGCALKAEDAGCPGK